MLQRRIAERVGIDSLEVSLFDIIDSTSNEARRLAEKARSTPRLIIARAQSAGRGRLGRSFYSPSGTGLYMTALFGASERPSDNVMLTTAAAVAVAMAIDSLCRVRTEIKWVNDIYLGTKKICGILCESFECGSERYVSVGIGINLYTEEFPPELSGVADSLRPRPNIEYDLAAEIFTRLYSFWRDMPTEEIIEYYRERSLVLGKRIMYAENGERYRASAVDIDRYGRLLVRGEDGKIKILSSGEISLRLDDNTEV